MTARPDVRPTGAEQTPTTGPAVRVEVLFLRLDGDGQVACRRSGAPVGPGPGPHEVALGLCGGPDAAELLHSTSWRHDPEQGLVLTYVAVPDPDPAAPAVTLVDPCIVASGDAVRPQPDLLHPHHVVAHAVRHLAELAWRDPAVGEAARRGDPALWRRVAEVAAASPTETHDRAHLLARGRTHRDDDARDAGTAGTAGTPGVPV